MLDLADWIEETGGSPAESSKLILQAARIGNLPAIEQLARDKKVTKDAEISALIQQARSNPGSLLYARPAPRGNNPNNLQVWDHIRELQETNRNDEALPLLRQEAEAGDAYAMIEWAVHLAKAGRQREAEHLVAKASSAGLAYGWQSLLFLKLTDKDYSEAERLSFKMLEAGQFEEFAEYIEQVAEFVQPEECERILSTAVDSGYAAVLHFLDEPYPGYTDWGEVRDSGIQAD
ncbi:hypothetical protein ACPCAA_21060 [Streptomyces griseoincarnatus]